MRPRRPLDPYWMLAPTLTLLVLFFVYPLFNAIYLSFYKWDLLTPPRYVGTANYAALFHDGTLGNALFTTSVFSLVVVAGSMFLGLGLALLLNRPGKLAAWVRGSVFSAYVVSWVSVALLWLWVLDADAGVVAELLSSVGLPKVNWLGDPNVAIYTLSLITIWKIAGYSMVIFIAGLQDVPPVLHQAAALDGARPIARFRYITWPLLRPTAAFVATTSLILSFQVFDVVRVMTQGGPVRSTTVFVYAIYEQLFMNLRVGRANALVVVFFALLLALTALQLWLWKKRGQTN